MEPDIKFTCGNCGKRLTQAAEMAGKTVDCSWCGKQTVAPSTASGVGNPEQVNSSTAPTYKACPFCGEQILSIAKKCKHCGEFLTSAGIKSHQHFSVAVRFLGKALVFLCISLCLLGVGYALSRKMLKEQHEPVRLFNKIEIDQQLREAARIDRELKSKQALLYHLKQLRKDLGDNNPDDLERETEKEVELLLDAQRLLQQPK